MSIVSSLLGVVSVKATPPPTNAVQFVYDEMPDSVSVSQKPTFNGKCCKATCPPRPDPSTPYPLYSLQEGSECPRPLFQEYDGPVIPAAKPKVGNTITDLLKLQDTTSIEVPFNYQAGIRPAPRKIKIDSIAVQSSDLFRDSEELPG